MSAKVPVICNECGKKWKVAADAKTGPQCSRCNSVDVDVREEQ